MTMKPSSPFHAGEIAAQQKAGTAGVAMELAVGMTDSLSFASNHDAFLAAQSFAVLTTVNLQADSVWISPLFGNPGDIQALSEKEIVISKRCLPPGDVAREAAAATHVSLLGIDLKKRVRHRINGQMDVQTDAADASIQFAVQEYSPNCPKYINRRELIRTPGNAGPVNIDAERQERAHLTKADQTFIESMDTLWIGTYAPGAGADANHRGGKPGFVRVTSASTIEWPEYRGNGMFYTSGNLESCDRAGVLFVDFDSGSIIQMTGAAVVDWEHGGQYEGATRVIKFNIDKLVRMDNVTSHRWARLDFSPYNPKISGSDDSDDSSNGEFPTAATLVKVVEESEHVKTFRFVASRQIPFLPGQYATFEFANLPGVTGSEIRTWTLSETPNSVNGDNTLDITVKRIPNGLVTNWLHEHAQLGSEVVLNGVQGEMTALWRDPQTQKLAVHKDILLISAGIGITPNIAMVRGIGAFDLQDKTNITMIHVERYEHDLIFQEEIARRARVYPKFHYTNIVSSREGRPTLEKLKTLISNKPGQEVYICGPAGFMSQMRESLVHLGIPPAKIRTESFEF